MVKKRSFVATVKRRYAHATNFDATTIDSYLMRNLSISNFVSWLSRKAERAHELIELATIDKYVKPRSVEAKNTVFFVDKFGLIDGLMADLLRLILRYCACVLVGDCNQQSPIEEPPDRPMRTVLAYNRVRFMYDNVRAKDDRMLRRLQHFYLHTTSACTDAIRGLCDSRLLIVRANDIYNNERKRFESSLIPRVIVTSNTKANRINWYIGNCLWEYVSTVNSQNNASIDLEHEEISPVLCYDAYNDFACAKYSRCIVRVSKYAIDTKHIDAQIDVNVACERNLSNATPSYLRAVLNSRLASITLEPDDPYADEHFLAIGVVYRVIHTEKQWPLELGSRVQIISISPGAERVIVSTTIQTRCTRYDARL